MKTNTKPAVVYIRGMADNSNENQQWLIEKQVSGSEYRTTAIFSDTCSGISDISRRPGWQQLLEALQTEPDIHDVIVYDESRLSRRASDAVLAIQCLSDMNVKVHYAANGFGSTQLETWVANLIRMEERRVHGERIRRAKQLKISI